jgi:8-oxo-dGTP diphosphatase
VIEAAGGVVWRRSPAGELEVLLVHRPRYDDWSLPKGKLDPGESAEEAARREVEEEAGVRARLGIELEEVRYVDRNGRRKRVRYWAMQPEGDPEGEDGGDGGFTPNDEVDEVRWVRWDEAAERVTYERDAALLRGIDAAVLR